MDLNTTKNYYFTRSEMLNKKHEELVTTTFSIRDIFDRKRISEYRGLIRQYYMWLHEYDTVLSENLSLSGENYELQPRAVKAEMTLIARSVYVSSIESYEKELSNIESSMNFRLTTIIALFALVLSVMSIASSLT